MRVFFLLGVLTFFTGVLRSQPQLLWTDKPQTEMRTAGGRMLFPLRYRTCGLDVPAIQQFLSTVPQEHEVPPVLSNALLSVPAPDGTMDTFRIVAYQMMEPGLAARYPDFRTLRGLHLHDPNKRIRCDWTVNGFSAIVTSRAGRYYIEPFARQNQEDYIIFNKWDYPQPKQPFICEVEDAMPHHDYPNQRVQGDCVFRSYRLAVAAAGEYSNYFGAESPADEALVLAQVVICVNRVNEVYEQDFAVRLILIDNTTDVFYYDPATDPYSGSACNQLSQNQSTMTSVIGSGNYDIGHVFSTGSGGCAQLGVVCSNSNKAKGATGIPNPVGDPFYIDYVAHEMGHQFGGNHCFNNSCSGNRHDATAYEPGSGSTIMAYAGVCSPNVQNNSDAYFHAISIQEIDAYITSGNGNSCDVPIEFNNSPPVLTSGSDYTIPVSTPFMLTADASDPDDDTLTYCWEQWDPEIGPVMPPASTNSVGPMFRSLFPDPSPTRYFPRLSDLVSNTNYDWEVLPSVSRSMEFRVTVRDYHDGLAGCTDEDNVMVTTSASSGPFVVTYPNTGSVEWLEGDTKTVTWDVANTTSSPVSCANVDILLSYDGGYTYPEVLASGVPNDGSQDIEVPEGVTTQARVMVKGAGNIFFDISNADFTIAVGIPTYALEVSPELQTGCPPGFVEYTVSVLSILGYDGPVLLSATGGPAGAIITFAPNPVIPGNISTMTVTLPDGVSDGVYNLTINGSSISGPKSTTADLVVGTQGVALLTPEDEATGIPVQAELNWEENTGSQDYVVEVATDALFEDIVFDDTTATGMATTPVLDAITVYYWRVKSINPCGDGGWSETRAFQTESCTLDYSTDVPKVIPSQGTPTITSNLTIDLSGTIVDVNVIDLIGTHTWLGDLQFTLSSPEGTDVLMIDQWCNSEDNFNINLDDQADPGSPPCPYNDGGTYQPENPLSAFNGENSAGTWVLTVHDVANQDGGSLNSWALEICLSDGCALVVSNTADSGLGSLRNTLACAADGDTITFASGLHDNSIALLSPVMINNQVTLLSSMGENIALDGSAASRAVEIGVDAVARIEGLTVLTGTNALGSGIWNMGDLHLKDVVIMPGTNPENVLENLGTLTLQGNCQLGD